MKKIDLVKSIDLDLSFFNGQFEVILFKNDSDDHHETVKFSLDDIKTDMIGNYCIGIYPHDYYMPKNDYTRDLLSDVSKLASFFADMQKELESKIQDR